MLELAHGIEYIHSEGVVHGDLRGVFYLIAVCRIIEPFLG